MSDAFRGTDCAPVRRKQTMICKMVIAPIVADSQLLIVNQAGHYVFRDQADKVNRLVKEFIYSL